MKNENDTGSREFLELAKRRKTVYEFSRRKVSGSTLKKILEAGRWAPSAHNCQNWRFIVVKDPVKIDELMKTCYYGDFKHKPNVIIAFIREPIFEDRPGLLRGEFARYAESHKYMNIVSPLLHMVYEAVSLGLGTFIATPKTDAADRILRVPKDRETVLIAGFGYEKEGAFQKKRVRKELSAIVSHESYDDKEG